MHGALAGVRGVLAGWGGLGRAGRCTRCAAEPNARPHRAVSGGRAPQRERRAPRRASRLSPRRPSRRFTYSRTAATPEPTQRSTRSATPAVSCTIFPLAEDRWPRQSHPTPHARPSPGCPTRLDGPVRRHQHEPGYHRRTFGASQARRGRSPTGCAPRRRRCHARGTLTSAPSPHGPARDPAPQRPAVHKGTRVHPAHVLPGGRGWQRLVGLRSHEQHRLPRSWFADGPDPGARTVPAAFGGGPARGVAALTWPAPLR